MGNSYNSEITNLSAVFTANILASHLIIRAIYHGVQGHDELQSAAYTAGLSLCNRFSSQFPNALKRHKEEKLSPWKRHHFKPFTLLSKWQKSSFGSFGQLVRALLWEQHSLRWKEWHNLYLVHILIFFILQIPRRQSVGVTMLMLICSQAETSSFWTSAKKEVVTMETSQVEANLEGLVTLC